MALPKIERHRIDKFLFEMLVHKSPAFARDSMRLSSSTKGNNMTLIESCPYLHDPRRWSDYKVVQLEYNQESKKWCLYYYDGKLKRQRYPNGVEISLGKLVEGVIKDPTAIFLR